MKIIKAFGTAEFPVDIFDNINKLLRNIFEEHEDFGFYRIGVYVKGFLMHPKDYDPAWAQQCQILDRDMKSAICIENEECKQIPADHRNLKAREIQSSTFFDILSKISNIKVSKIESVN